MVLGTVGGQGCVCVKSSDSLRMQWFQAQAVLRCLLVTWREYHPSQVLNVGKYYLVSPEILPVRNFIGIVNQHPL